MSIARLLVEENYRTRNGAGPVVIVGDHVQQLAPINDRPAIAEKCFLRFLAVVRDGDVLLRIRREPPAIFVAVLIASRLIRIPNAAVTSGSVELVRSRRVIATRW